MSSLQPVLCPTSAVRHTFVLVLWGLMLAGGVGLIACTKTPPPLIRLESPPKMLKLPLQDASTQLSVFLRYDHPPQRVWIATGLGSPLEFEMESTGQWRYQADLNSKALFAALEVTGGKGEAFVFAEFKDGFQIASLPFRYELEGVAERIIVQPLTPLESEEIPSEESTSTPKASPIDALALGGAVRELRIKQRSSVELPGSKGQVLISVGDISKLETRVSIHGPALGVLLPTIKIKTGQEQLFSLGNHAYALRADALTSNPFGEDFAAFSLWEVTEEGALEKSQVPKQIQEMILRLERSSVRFIRNGEEYSGADAARLLRYKLEHEDSPSESLDAFIGKHASKSNSGEPYLVRGADNQTRPAAEWLRALMSE